jgi:hypothetical protein
LISKNSKTEAEDHNYILMKIYKSNLEKIQSHGGELIAKILYGLMTNNNQEWGQYDEVFWKYFY